MPRSTLDGPADAEVGPGFGRQGRVGTHADDDEHQVGEGGRARHRSASTASIWKRPAEPFGARAMRLTVVLVLTSTPCALQLGIDQGTKAGVHGREHLGQLLELGDRQPTGPQALRHLESDVARAHDHRTGRLVLVERAHQLEGVAHRVEQMHPVGWTQCIGANEALDGRPGRDGPGPDDELVVGDLVLDARLVDHVQAAACDVDLGGRVLRRTCIPVALRSSSVRWARLRQWVTSPET